MTPIALEAHGKAISDAELAESLRTSLSGLPLKKVLLLPPDMTRLHSYAGRITEILCAQLKGRCQVDIMPAIGTHDAMTHAECAAFFGTEIPFERILPHRWKTDVVKIGQVPSDFVKQVSDDLIDDPIDIEVNARLMDPSYDLIVSIGQVVPHEVVGMANYSKNLFVGCGGRACINRTHFLGAVYGMERVIGRDGSPVRKVFDYAEREFFSHRPLLYVLTVTTVDRDAVSLEGLYIGRDRSLFEKAVALSQKCNLTNLDPAPRKVVAHLDEREFKSTWIGNKAVYRTRMALADDGELLVLAPGVRKFGEDPGIDALIRKYGYAGRLGVLEQVRNNRDLQDNLSAAAHLIHGSPDGRFTVTYAVDKMTREEIEGVGYRYMALSDALARYDPNRLEDGFNTMPDGEEIYFIRNPAVGLWVDRKRFENQP